MSLVTPWLIAALPAALFVGLAALGLLLPLSTPWVAISAGCAVLLVLLMAWLLVLPRWSYRRVLARLPLRSDEFIERSWIRAFDGIGQPGLRPRLRLLESSAPLLLAMQAPHAEPLLVVSSGWLYQNGEESFREACRRSLARFSSPSIRLWTAGACVMALIQTGLSKSFREFVVQPRSEDTAHARLGAIRFALSLPFLAWFSWIRGVLRAVPLDGDHPLAGSGPELDWMGRRDAELSALHQLLSLERPFAGRVAEKSILSWLPTHW